jgi:hypothetical protein
MTHLRSLSLLLALSIGCGDDDATVIPDGGVQSDAGPDSGTDGGAVVPGAACDPSIEGRIESGSWDTSFTIAGLTGYDGFTPQVHSLARDADGSILAAGYFLWSGSERVGPVARLRDGSWEAARTDLEKPDFGAVAVSGDRVALATFAPLLPIVGPPPQSGEIFVDTGSGLTSVGEFLGVVRALAWVGDDLWIGGHFQLLDGGPAELAVWDGTSWSTAPGGTTNGPVYVLTVEGDSVLVGGAFSRIGGVEAQSVATYEAGTWTALSMDGLEPTPYGAFQGPVVYGLARAGDDTLYAGGIFFPSGSPTAGGVARWDGDGWEILGDGFADYGGLAGDEAAVVADVIVHDGDLYAAGCFTRVGGDPEGATALGGIARWSGTAWEALPSDDVYLGTPWFHANVCGGEPSGTAIMEAEIQTLESDGENLYVAGAFPGMGGVASKAVIAFDGEAWVPQGQIGNGVIGTTTELATGAAGCDLYAFGGVTQAGTATGGVVYRFSAGSWSVVAPSLPEGVTCYQLAVSDEGDVYIGCETEFMEGPIPGSIPRVYRLDGTAWTALPEHEGVRGSVVVSDMVFDREGRLWLGGGDGAVGFVASWDDDELGTAITDFDGSVFRIAFAPGTNDLVVGGSFVHAGTVEVNGVARFDGTTWSGYGTGLETPQETPVSALAVTEDAVYVSTHSGGANHVVLARWDGTSWEELGTEARGLAAHLGAAEGGEHQFYRLWADGDRVIAAGSAYPTTGGRNVYLFDGERFTALGGGVGAISVESFAASPDALWFGGTVTTTGDGDTLAPSVGIARFALGAR